MMAGLPEIPHSRENAIQFFIRYVAEHKATLAGKTVVDLSAGSGFIANAFHEAGARVQLYDLFPEQNTFCSVAAKKMDLQGSWSIPDNSVDILILAETIEHLPDQNFFFQEASRVLKQSGELLLTTPNASSLRSRFSQFLMESEHYSHPAPNETNAFTRWPGSSSGYFSKMFISGVLRLRTLAALHELKITEIIPTKSSSTSVLLMVFYPFIYYFSRRNRQRQTKENPSHRDIYQEIFSINTSRQVLLSKHLIIRFSKSRIG